MRSFLTLALLAPVALAQYDYGNSGGSSSSMPAPASTTSSSPAQATQTVSVGANGLTFSPNSITANVGDTITFAFNGGNHTVTEAAFSNPCNPMTKGFFSGFTGSNSETFSIVVTSTDPIWFYCAQITHCQLGMVGAINPPTTGNTLAAFQKAASSANTKSTPSAVYGGVVSVKGSPASTAPGAASVTGSPASPTSSGGSASSSSPSPTGNSAVSLSGGLAMVAVGAVGVAALLV
ncbi:hypothetical protein TWF694_005040 [Orbilia ellipsospora]|uniref:Extracellular serine-rich protein n=1 Tax=Orbilia ellipsospora TaxID=2528407 RepID=A0AAV9WUF1_9PEZI